MTTKEAAIKDIDNMLEIQYASSNYDEYMRGMYNGMEFARCILASCEPVYVNPDGELDAEAKERSPERYV